MNFGEYLSIAATVQARTDYWRTGQAYFNVLTQARPDLADQVRGTDLDPFHDDARVGPFVAFLQENWEVSS